MIVFHALTEADLEQIVELLLAELGRRLEDQDLALELTPAARALIVREGTDPAYGARPLKRTIQRLVENPLARALVSGEFKPGDRITADADLGSGTIVFSTRGRDRGDRGRHATRRAATGRRGRGRARSAPEADGRHRSTCRRPSASAATAIWSTRRDRLIAPAA